MPAAKKHPHYSKLPAIFGAPALVSLLKGCGMRPPVAKSVR